MKSSNQIFFRKGEISFSDLTFMIYRRKHILLVSLGLLLFLVFLYNFLATPQFQSSVVMKKENVEGTRYLDEFQKIVSLQKSDVITTEMEIVKTRTVLDKVLKELKLYLNIKKIELPDGETIEINQNLVNYEHKYLKVSDSGDRYPRFFDLDLKPTKTSHSYYIKSMAKGIFGLYDAKSNQLLQSIKGNVSFTFNLPHLMIVFTWPEVKINEKIFFDIANYHEALNALKSSISLKHRAKSNLFEVAVRSPSPYSATLITNTVAEKFRETRIEQKQQTVHYSFDFVDKQLKEVSQKLAQAEDTLSKFKSERKITSIAENSRDIVEFLSNLETEKVKTDLSLAEYQNKLKKMVSEYKSRGYFDQTYLAPVKESDTYTPFSTLLGKLSDLELRRLELLQKRKETHPDVISLDEQVQQVKSRLSDYNQNTLSAYRIIISSLKKKQYDLARLITNYSNRIENLPVHETQLAELMREKSVYEKIFTLLLDKREQLRIQELSKLQDIVIIDLAHEPLEPVSPRKALNLFLGLLFGLAVGFTIILVLEYNDRKYVDLSEIESDENYPILIIIPNYPKSLLKSTKNGNSIEDRFVTLMKDQHSFHESYRLLKTKLFNLIDFNEAESFSKNTNNKKIIIFTSCEEGTGKSTIVSNLGISLAQSGKKVLIMDCDLRNPKLARYFGLTQDFSHNGKSGLLKYLKTQDKKSDYSALIKSFDQNDSLNTLHLLPAGGVTQNSSDLLGIERMKKLLDKLVEYDIILLDTPPVTKIVDTLVLGKLVKNTILIIRPNHTFKDGVKLAIQEMENVDMKILGFIINACDIAKSSYSYKYGYGYGYGHSYAAKKQV